MSPGCNDIMAINPSAAFCEEENGAAWNVLHIHPRAGEHMLARHGLMTSMRGHNEVCLSAVCTATFANALYIPNAAELSLMRKTNPYRAAIIIIVTEIANAVWQRREPCKGA
jgi:hypothetical protein